jgi:outer membrane lipoprotein-sorting protein
MRRSDRRARLWLRVGVPLACATALAHGSPARLLRAAEEADQRLSYTGVRIVRSFRGDAERERKVRVWHLAPDRTRIEYLSPESGNVLLEFGSSRWYYSQRRGSWRAIEWQTSRPDLGLLLRNYQVRSEGAGMVAGRRVIQLVIEPRRPGNPSKRVWIDPGTRMTLREEVRDEAGRLIASSAFEQIELVREMSPSLFDPPAVAATRAAPPPPPFPPLRPRYLPPGYQEVRQSGLRRSPGEGVYLRYTDGLGTISLFQFRGQPGVAPDAGSPKRDRLWGGPRRGPGALGRTTGPPPLSRQIGDLSCTVMGDVAPGELRKLLDSIPARP